MLGRRADGYHELESLVAFADLADKLDLEPGESATLDVTGPFATACGPRADNLVLKAVEALRDRSAGLKAGRFMLEKNLPVAAGIGGGSADAAAALRLLARANGMAPRRCAPGQRGARGRRRRAGLPRPDAAHHARRRRLAVRAARFAAACRRCWSIRACRWRPATCLPPSPARRATRILANVPSTLDGMIGFLNETRQRPHRGGDRLRARSSPKC